MEICTCLVDDCIKKAKSKAQLIKIWREQIEKYDPEEIIFWNGRSGTTATESLRLRTKSKSKLL